MGLYAVSIAATGTNGVTFSRDGVSVGPGSLTSYLTSYTAPHRRMTAPIRGVFGRVLRYDLALLWCWPGAVTLADLRRLAADPWQLFAPGPLGSWAWSPPPVVVAGARVQGRRPVFLLAPRAAAAAIVGRRTLTPRVGSRGPA